jgi:hypothetical protein
MKILSKVFFALFLLYIYFEYIKTRIASNLVLKSIEQSRADENNRC